MRRELLDGELPRSVTEARVVIGDWVELYTNVCPHRGLRMRTPARFIGEQRALLTTKRAASPVGTPPRYDRKPVSVVTFTTFRYLVCHVGGPNGWPKGWDVTAMRYAFPFGPPALPGQAERRWSRASIRTRIEVSGGRGGTAFGPRLRTTRTSSVWAAAWDELRGPSGPSPSVKRGPTRSGALWPEGPGP